VSRSDLSETATDTPSAAKGNKSRKKSKKVVKKKAPVTKRETNKPITEMARVRYSMGMTINKGNYESVRVDCSFDRPCYYDEVDVVHGMVKDTVVKWLEDAVVEVRNALGITEQAEEEAHGDLNLQEPPETTPQAQEPGDLDTAPWDDDSGKEPLSKSPSKEPILDEIVQGDDLLKELMDD